MKARQAAVGVALVGAAGVMAVFAAQQAATAHPDDYKVLHAKPIYTGPGYRRDRDGAAQGTFPADGVELMSWVTIPEFGNHSGAMACVGYTSPSGREYAIIGLSEGTGFAEITNPGDAQVITTIPGASSGWREMAVYGHHCYSVNESANGVQVIDMSQIDNGIVTHVRNVTTGGATQTHTVQVNAQSGYLYRNGGSSNGLRIYSLADPANPQYVAEWQERYVHDCQVVTYTSGPYAGREIAFCCGGFNGGWEQPGLSIVDVTDKQNIFTITHYRYPGAAYSHQGFLSEDRQYFYHDDELDEWNNGGTTNSRVIDVSNLSAPVQVATFTSGTTAIDHNQFVKGNRLFQANYTSGLRVFDISSPTAPVQVAWFDTHPEDDGPSFNSLWGTWPFYDSGTIIGSSRERGLFVWRLESATELDDVSVATGIIVSGGLAEIQASDNQRLRTRSGFGTSFIELHMLDLRVHAATTADSASSIDLTIESRINQPAGTARVLLLNHATGQYEQVGSYAVNDTEGTHVITGIPAADYVDAEGGIAVGIKHLVFVPIFAFQFDSFFDLIEVGVN